MLSRVNDYNRWWHVKIPNIVLILGCDIKDATQYKTTNENTWMFNISEQLRKVELLTSDVFNHEISMLTWKRLGDEVLFCIFPKNRFELVESIKKCYEVFERRKSVEIGFSLKFRLFCAGYHYLNGFVLVESTGSRSDNEKFEEYKQADYINYRTGNLLHRVLQKPEIKPHSYNNGDLKEYDFIGPDIDIGFRISEFATDNDLLISDKIAHIIKAFDITDYNYQILKGKVLKGVWNNNEYPKIYMSKCNNSSFQDIQSLYEKIGIQTKQLNFITKTKELLE